mmetsp:Transcript_16781/g.38561  ORF Transcript_16781/g.38561 Transcript_16781/m.38561 type:complete len:99 (+) Transcript_16781:228-524(+)
MYGFWYSTNVLSTIPCDLHLACASRGSEFLSNDLALRLFFLRNHDNTAFPKNNNNRPRQQTTFPVVTGSKKRLRRCQKDRKTEGWLRMQTPCIRSKKW